jgi:hypothetical protein
LRVHAYTCGTGGSSGSSRSPELRLRATGLYSANRTCEDPGRPNRLRPRPHYIPGLRVTLRIRLPRRDPKRSGFKSCKRPERPSVSHLPTPKHSGRIPTSPPTRSPSRRRLGSSVTEYVSVFQYILDLTGQGRGHDPARASVHRQAFPGRKPKFSSVQRATHGTEMTWEGFARRLLPTIWIQLWGVAGGHRRDQRCAGESRWAG